MPKCLQASAMLGLLAAAGCAAVRSEKFETQECNFGQNLVHGAECSEFAKDEPDVDAGDKSFPRFAQKGVAYFLPKQKLRITAVRAIKPLPSVDAVRGAYQKALKARDDAVTEAAAKTAAHSAAKAQLEALKARNADAPLIAAAEQRVVQADLNERAALAAKEAAAADLVRAEELLALRIAEPGSSGVMETKIELKILDAEPDPEALYYATPRHGITRDDTLKVVVGANGLLASSNIVADDRTDEIIVEAAGAVALFLRGGALTFAPANRESTPKANKPCPREKTEPLTFDTIVDPADISTANETLGACFGYRVKATPAEYEKAGFARHARASYPGYAYRARIPWTINLERYHGENNTNDEEKFVIEKSFVALLPNGGPVAYIPIKAAPFVRTVNDVTFKDGSIASWDNTRPSEALEAVRLPVRVAKQIVSVPTELLQMKVDFSSKEKAMAEVQAAQIATETKLRHLQECLAKEIGAGNDGATCVK